MAATLAPVRTRTPHRVDGYAPIRDYAAIGDGRTMALVSLDGAVDWLCLPHLDSPSVFGALLDADEGGRTTLAPTAPYEAQRRYRPGTNVLETTFTTAQGAVRVTDALTFADVGLTPSRELVRRAEGLSGRVPMRWSVEARFGYGSARTRLGRRLGVPVAVAGADALAISSWGAGDPEAWAGSVGARFTLDAGGRALVSLTAAHQEPLVLPTRQEAEARLDATAAFWESWTGALTYEGPWREAVVRSGLVLKLLVHARSGAMAAAPTSSLPEDVGGERNWDYRCCWVRDAAFAVDALMRLGCSAEADAFFWWLMHASQRTHPRLSVLYRLDGGSSSRERVLPLAGYRGSRPVRVGNAAASQHQLDVYGDLLETAWVYASRGGRLDPDVAKRVAGAADLVCRVWREPDAGIWEVRSEPRQFTQSKMMAWVALDRAVRLAERGLVPSRHTARWRRTADAVRRYVVTECWSPGRASYVRSARSDDLDAAVLTGILFGFEDPGSPRARGTLDALRRALGDGPYLRRYNGDDGLEGREGAFLACSFWVVEALALVGRVDEAAEAMETLVASANDVGLLSEEIDPSSGDFLGNFPQALTHLALVRAAGRLAEAGVT